MPSVFKAIQFQTIDACNRSCGFCPNAAGIRKSGNIMSADIIDRILNQLLEINYKGRISPYLMNEPLLDSRLFSIAHNIKNNFPDNIVFISTNGDQLRDSKIRAELASSKIDGIHVDCYDDKNSFIEMKEFLDEMSKNFKNVQIHSKSSLRLMGKPNGKVNIKAIWIPEARPDFWNRGGNIQNVNSRNRLDICNFPMKQMCINFLGDSILCCSDWRFQVIMGNVLKTSLWDIWNYSKYNFYREALQNGKREQLRLCKTCNRIQ